jgi:hypothetical protein
MGNLSKIKNLAKSLSKEFGDTPEGQGYIMIFNMLEKEETSAPSTLNDLWRTLNDELVKNEVSKNHLRIEIQTYGLGDSKYQSYLLDKSVEATTPKMFLDKCRETIKTESENYKKKIAEKSVQNNIAL